MDHFAEISMPTVAIASAFSVAMAAYLDAKFSLSTDVSALLSRRSYAKRIADHVAQLGDVATIYRMLERVLEQGEGETEALWFERKIWSYAHLKDSVVDRFAAVLQVRGIKSEDFVGVFTTNSPEMVVTLYALAKLDDTFLHCLGVSRATSIISTPDISGFVSTDLPQISLNLGSFEDSSSPVDLITHSDLQQVSPTGLQLGPAKRTPRDLAALIYTSGTTGKPKACAVRNSLAIATATPLTSDANNPSKYRPPSNLFLPPTLPRHRILHRTLLLRTLCLRRKFSASQFWKDVHDSRATRILYIGELCRYLLATPPSPYDRNHNCIVASGNGLRAEIWERFKTRFNVPEIREFYRSTEGVAKFDNHGVGVWGAGKVGFAGPLARALEKDNVLVKYDPDTEMPWRDPATGFCVRARLGEEGEAIGRVHDIHSLTEYLHNEEATQKKLLRDVFEKGDVFQRTGDLLVQDESGWIKFQDRMGDTFRWKGENVSAGEIRDHICRIEGVHDAVVYGVKLDGYDGQAGAAAITLEDQSAASQSAFISKLYGELKAKGVPSYAFPRLNAYVNVINRVSTGVTFKQAKGDLVKRKWVPGKNQTDGLYWLNGTRYERLDLPSWSQIEQGRAKL
ncbi:hypothetical protein N7468_005462 [Penicillium chermesinum]|uniref:AMP-dependent synthetase/ligase domain-containing protein n=1 Tax=Penicillium chermesinum TaxID=63820 RepID=A0A9W9TN06_9EURO|nr:uncharacterized protein N7468_005462 [Penicillium chermesinum]KAJ5232506.1 hypothetical protein N7468_005462 [Penicillium chermesinum]